MSADPFARRRAQNLSATRVDARIVTPSTRDFAQPFAGRKERIPLLHCARADLVSAALALDAAEALALAFSLDDPSVELARFSQAAQAVSVPVLRTDLVLEEFQIYESRAAGADAVVLRPDALQDEPLARLFRAARSTHMIPVMHCATPADLQRALSLQPLALLLAPALLDAPRPPRTLVLSDTLDSRADAVLDPSLDTPEAFRQTLEE